MALNYDISNLSFLMVDDNHYMRSILKTMLSGFGCRNVYEAGDVAMAFELFRTHAIDIILTDLQMDTLDGSEFTHMVRTAKDSPNPFVPIIMLTAYTERHRVEQARDAGITEFLSKPICAKDLFLRVVSCVEQARHFVREPGFVGPDRRRTRNDGYKGEDRRGQASS
ncbi:MAG: two-component system response regulator [Hyphomicrobiales bacterium]|nr:MAG: two-component system response regulator [Hyphomicrobiales bacterium]